MEYIKKEELIEGEIYKADNGSLTYIMKATKDLENVKNIPEYCDFMKHRYFNGSYLTFTNATSEEKHWLNCCITADKFITFEEAMKTFIPEYVEWIDNIGSGNLGYQTSYHFKKNKIFKTDAELPSHGFQTQNWIKHLEIYANNYKPSTKEAYDAQFVVKEPEFVLPEKWCILRTGNNYNIINKWFQDNNLGKPYMNYGYIWKSNNNYYTYLTKPGHRTEITFDQFKKYVLKEEIVVEEVIEQPITENKTELEIWLENTKSLNLSLEDLEEYIESGQTCNFDNIYMKLEGHYSKGRAKILFDKWNEKVIEPLPQFKIIETIETITKVENNEGNQFFIGDVVKTEAGLHFKIIGFKYDENKTKILAIATDNYPEVVKDINDIEHYIEPKVEETLLEKAKRLYPIGTKFINPNDNEECVIKEKGNYFKGNNNNIYHSIANTVFKYEEGLSGCIYINNTWSKIIE